jgi:hypothetical protein
MYRARPKGWGRREQIRTEPTPVYRVPAQGDFPEGY